MDNFSNKVQVFLDYFIHHDGYKTVLLGLRNTAEIAMLGLLIGLVFGTVIATTRVIPRTNPVAKFFNGLSGLYVSLFRGTPIVVQLLVFYYVLMPLMNLHMNSVAVAVVVFGMNSAAYISEIMRAGILSVDSGQMEGGRAIGLSYATTMMKIVIPQAVKNILPALGNEFVTIIKESSIVSVIGIADLMYRAKGVIAKTYNSLECLAIAAIIYFILTFIGGRLIALMERKMSHGRK